MFDPMLQELNPLKYHISLRDYLKSVHEQVWDWFSSIEAKSNYSEEVELYLLKTTYRMTREGHEGLYSTVDDVLTALDIDVPVTLYQAQDTSHNSAALFFTPNHGHVVLVGSVMELLNEDELKALLAHELAHFKLWVEDDGEFLLTDQILTAMANEPRAAASHHQSARYHQLYTEIYADKGSLLLTDEQTAISTLIKVHTGLKKVDVQSYIQQAADIFSKGKVKTEGFSHPELFVRVQAVRAYSTRDSLEEYEAEVKNLIEGSSSLVELDILGQEKMTQNTRKFILYHLRDSWHRTGTVLAHAGHLFSDLSFEDMEEDSFVLDLSEAHKEVQDYYVYLLVDFASVDIDLEENAIAAAFLTAEKIGLADRFESIVSKELKILKKDIRRIRKEATTMVAKAAIESAKQKKEEADVPE